MRRKSRLRSGLQKICEEITRTLKRIPEHVEVEIGVRWQPLPKPVVDLYAKIRLLKKKKTAMLYESRKKSDKRVHNNDASISERNET